MYFYVNKIFFPLFYLVLKIALLKKTPFTINRFNPIICSKNNSWWKLKYTLHSWPVSLHCSSYWAALLLDHWRESYCTAPSPSHPVHSWGALSLACDSASVLLWTLGCSLRSCAAPVSGCDCCWRYMEPVSG